MVEGQGKYEVSKMSQVGPEQQDLYEEKTIYIQDKVKERNCNTVQHNFNNQNSCVLLAMCTHQILGTWVDTGLYTSSIGYILVSYVYVECAAQHDFNNQYFCVLPTPKTKCMD